jgi:hypothetical protein
MKRNTQTRKDYQKELDNQKQVREYKKKLFKFLVFFCKKNTKFYHKRLLALSDDGKEAELATLIRDSWVENNTSIRRDRTGFIDNSLYLEALVNNLLSEIPRVYSDDEGGEGEFYDSLSDEDDENEKIQDEEEVEEEEVEEKKVDVIAQSKGKVSDTKKCTKKEGNVVQKKSNTDVISKSEEAVDRPAKRRKVLSSTSK